MADEYDTALAVRVLSIHFRYQNGIERNRVEDWMLRCWDRVASVSDSVDVEYVEARGRKLIWDTRTAVLASILREVRTSHGTSYECRLLSKYAAFVPPPWRRTSSGFFSLAAVAPFLNIPCVFPTASSRAITVVDFSIVVAGLDFCRIGTSCADYIVLRGDIRLAYVRLINSIQ